MPSTYSTDLKIELMVTGENAGTWGDKTNDNFKVIQQAIAGYGSINIAGGAQTTALTIANSPTLSNARNIVLKFTGTITGNQIVTIPSGIEKTYIVSNETTGAFTLQFKTTDGGSTGTTWSATDKGIKVLFSDGTEIFPVDLDTLSGTIASTQIGNISVTSAKLASFAVTTAKLASYAVTAAKLDTGAITGIKITQSTITQAKLASNSVGSDQLISTGITAGTYSKINITVDADGRITSIATGSGSGAGMEIPTRYSVGPTSGTHTAQPTASRLGVYMYAGASGGQGAGGCGGPGRNGAVGGFGFYNAPIVQPFSQPFSVGGGGSGGAGNQSGVSGGQGSAGGNTTLTNVGTVNGGGAPTPNSPGASGSAPGASFTYSPRTFVVGGEFGSPAGNGGFAPECVPESPSNPGNPGNAGASGVLVIFENTGT